MSVATVLSTSITTVFLLVVLSYYVLLFRRRSTPAVTEQFPSITVLIPAHNEAKYIAACVAAAKKAAFAGMKEIIVIDDGSTDDTVKIARKAGATVYSRKHSGKAASLNFGIAKAKGKLVAVVDADSEIHADALKEAVKLFYPKVAAVCAVIHVKNRRTPLGFWLHMEQLYGSLSRSLFAKVNSNIVAAGPLTVFRKDALQKINGFSEEGFSEDVDIAVRLIRAGYHVEYAEKSVTETNMPLSIKGFYRQRRRFARGWVNILKKHFKLDRTLLQVYTLPLALFTYLQAVIMGVLMLYAIGSGYYQYFVAKGVFFSWYAAKFFLEWLSIIGVVKWAISIFNGTTPLTIVSGIGLASALLSYPLYVVAAVKYDRFSLWHVLAIMFLFPFWLIVMTVYIINIDAWFAGKQRNIWTK